MTVTPINEWQPAVEELTLPSKKVIKARRPDLVAMIAEGEGDTPDLLSNMVMQMISNPGSRSEVAITPETLPQIMSSLNVIAIAAFVEPRLWDKDEADDEHIPVGWVSFADKAFVMAWALGGQYEPAKTFPEKSNGHMATIQAGSPISGASKRVIRHQR